MSQVIVAFLDRLVERLAALVASLVSSRLASLQAGIQAEQQSQLEDLARQFEAGGKVQIAATLRERAAQLTSADLAGEATQMLQHVAGEEPTTQVPAKSLPTVDLRGLPEWPELPAKPRGKRSASAKPSTDHDIPGTGV